MTNQDYDKATSEAAATDPAGLTTNPNKEGITMAMKAVTKTNIDNQEALLPADPMVSMIERVAMDPNADLAKLERMMEMRDRHEAREAEKAFAAAFASASAEFPVIPLNGKGHNGKPYATLKDITSKTRPHLSQYGLALTFSIDVGSDVVVTAELMHRQGHSKRTSIALPRETSGSKNAVQAVGSSQTYGQRYAAQAILGLSLGDDTDDDGAAASGPATISADQFIILRDLIEQTKTDEVKFHLAHGHTNPEAANLHQFPVAKFETAKAQLERKLAKMGGQNA